MALYSLYCADVPLRNCSLTHIRAQALSVHDVTCTVLGGLDPELVDDINCGEHGEHARITRCTCLQIVLRRPPSRQLHWKQWMQMSHSSHICGHVPA